MFEAFRDRARLTPSERRAFDDKLIEGTFSASELLEQLDTQFALARAAKRTSESLKQTFIMCWVFAVLAAVLVSIVLHTWWALPIVFIAFVVSALVLVLLRSQLRKFAMPSSQVFATAFPFLTVLKHDMASTEPIRVRVDLSDPKAAAKRTQVGAPYRFNAYHRVVDTTYVDAWFEGEAQLVDGSQLRWSVTDELRVSKREKRNPRGKTKIKWRMYKTSQIEISVSFPTKLYRVQEVPAMAGQKVWMKQNDKRCTLTVKRMVKRSSFDPLEPRQLLDAIGVAFRAAKPVRGVA